MPEQGTSTAPVSAVVVPSISTPAPPEVEATIERLSAHKTVRGVMICSREGPIIRQTGTVFEGEKGKKYASVVKRIVDVCKTGLLDDGGDLTGDELKFMRIRTKRHEIMITPDEHYLLIVLQDPTQ